MKTYKSRLRLVIFSMVFTLLVFQGVQSNAADKAPESPDVIVGSPNGQASVQQALASRYIIDFLSPENAPDKTLTIKNPEGANISATWVDPQHGYQVLTNVSFDGEVLTFNALSGTPGDEYFYFHLNLYESYLVGYAKTKDMHKSPVVGKPVD